MEFIIKGEAKEIADLVLALQDQRNQKVTLMLDGEKLSTAEIRSPLDIISQAVRQAIDDGKYQVTGR